MKPDRPFEPSNPQMDPAAAMSWQRAGGQASALPLERAGDGPSPAARADAVLVERARSGDEEAFRMLVDLHRDRAYGLALRITRSPADAQDVAQEAFVRAWRALPAFRGESAFGTWLHRIVARRALDRAESLRARSRRESALDDAPMAEAPAGPERDVFLARRLDALMARLSPAQRAVLTLHYARDVAVEDIAQALGMPENTVKTHLARARAALRAAWASQGGAPA